MSVLYDHIGVQYDATRRADPAIAEELAALLALQHQGRYLDLACGTGNYTAALAAKGGYWHACDVSRIMLEAARGKSDLVAWSQCDVGRLGYGGESFDAVVSTLAIHHFPDLERAFAEVARVLKTRSALVLFTSTPEQMRNYWLCRYFPDMMERACRQMPALQAVEDALRAAGLELDRQQPFSVHPEIRDLFLYSGKFQPERYLSPEIRSGISTFCNLCTDDELEQGLAQLRADMDSGVIRRVIENSHSDHGDYLFVRALKN